MLALAGPAAAATPVNYGFTPPAVGSTLNLPATAGAWAVTNGNGSSPQSFVESSPIGSCPTVPDGLPVLDAEVGEASILAKQNLATVSTHSYTVQEYVCINFIGSASISGGGGSASSSSQGVWTSLTYTFTASAATTAFTLSTNGPYAVYLGAVHLTDLTVVPSPIIDPLVGGIALLLGLIAAGSVVLVRRRNASA